MKKMKFLVLVVLTFMFGMNNIYAECATSELNKVRSNAYKVSVSYELAKEETKEEFTPPDGLSDEQLENFVSYTNYFNVYINNVSEDLYVIVKDSLSGTSKTYRSSDAVSGVITIRDENMLKLNDYTIDVYAANEDCSRSKIRTITYKRPKYNEYSGYGMCDDLSNYYLCRQFIDFDIDYDFATVVERISSYKLSKEEEEAKNEKPTNKVQNFFEKNKVAIIIGGIIVAAGVATTIVIIVRKRGE